MKILLFENEFQQLKSCFDALKLLHFKNLSTTVFVKSQDMVDFKNALDYDFIFVDIHLTPKSTLDGFQIISKLIEINYPREKICVLTGWVNVKDELQAKGLNDIKSITKPVKLDTLYDTLKQLNMQ